MGKQSRRHTRRNRRRDWFGRPDVAFYVAWYGHRAQREEAKQVTWQALIDHMGDGVDAGQAEWLTYEGAEARSFLRQARREAAGMALVRHYNWIDAAIRARGGYVLIVTVPADTEQIARIVAALEPE